jgi:hypothetical protein
MGLLGGIGDFILGSGEYADPKNLHPSYGVPMSDVRQAAINQLGNMSAILLAAGQPMSGAQRGQLLAQIGGAGSGFNTDLLNASQRRLMQGQMQEKRAEMQELAVIRERQQKDPEGLAAAMGIDPQMVRTASASDLRQIAKQIAVTRATRDPLEQQKKQLEIDQMRTPPYSITRGEDGSVIAVNPRNPADFKVVQGGFAERPLTPEEKQAFSIPPNAPAVMTKTGPKILSAGGTTVNIGGDTTPDAALRKQLSEKEGERLSKALGAAMQAGGLAQDFEVIDELVKIAPQGPITGRLAQILPGASSAGAVFESFVKRIAPTLRVEGSGSTSDIEYEGMLKSIPQLVNKPEANVAIAEAMKMKAQLNVKRGEVIMAYQNQTIDANEMRKQLAELNRASILSPTLKMMLGQISGGATPAAGGGLRPSQDGTFTWSPGGN